MKTLMIIMVFYGRSISIQTVEFSTHDACNLSQPSIQSSIEKNMPRDWNSVAISCVEIQK